MALTKFSSHTIPAKGTIPAQGRRIQRLFDVGTADTPLVLTIPAGIMRKILKIVAVYSVNVSLTVTAVVDSGAGAALDHTLVSQTLSTQKTVVYIPDWELFLHTDDALIVTAPAGGTGVTAGILVECENFGDTSLDA